MKIRVWFKSGKRPQGKRKDVVMHHIEGLESSNFANAHIHQLSGTMKQRLAITQDLALNLKVLLTDESFDALYVVTREILRHQLYQFHHQITNKMVLFATYNTDREMALGNRIILIHIKKEFTINNLPDPRHLNHSMIDAITNEIKNLKKNLRKYRNGRD